MTYAIDCQWCGGSLDEHGQECLDCHREPEPQTFEDHMREAAYEAADRMHDAIKDGSF